MRDQAAVLGILTDSVTAGASWVLRHALAQGLMERLVLPLALKAACLVDEPVFAAVVHLFPDRCLRG
jgi:hypothetical protein